MLYRSETCTLNKDNLDCGYVHRLCKMLKVSWRGIKNEEILEMVQERL